MHYQHDTNGMVVIQKIGNGYLVTLPPKRENEYARQLMPLAREMRDMNNRDPLLEELQGEPEKKPDAPAYELVGVGNVFSFDTWEKVLEFLAVKFDEAEAADKE